MMNWKSNFKTIWFIRLNKHLLHLFRQPEFGFAYLDLLLFLNLERNPWKSE